MTSDAYKANYALIDWSGLRPLAPSARYVPARSDLPVPMFIRDDMDAVEHPHDGREYTSKSAFRAVTRANGYVEVGNDPARFNVPTRTAPDRAGIRAALKQAANRL